jgi:hypothetical protein
VTYSCCSNAFPRPRSFTVQSKFNIATRKWHFSKKSSFLKIWFIKSVHPSCVLIGNHKVENYAKVLSLLGFPLLFILKASSWKISQLFVEEYRWGLNQFFGKCQHAIFVYHEIRNQIDNTRELKICRETRKLYAIALYKNYASLKTWKALCFSWTTPTYVNSVARHSTYYLHGYR